MSGLSLNIDDDTPSSPRPPPPSRRASDEELPPFRSSLMDIESDIFYAPIRRQTRRTTRRSVNYSLFDFIALAMESCAALITSISIIIEQKIIKRGCIAFHIYYEIEERINDLIQLCSKTSNIKSLAKFSKKIKEFNSKIDSYVKTPYKKDVRLKELEEKFNELGQEYAELAETSPNLSVNSTLMRGIDQLNKNSDAIYKQVEFGWKFYPF